MQHLARQGMSRITMYPRADAPLLPPGLIEAIGDRRVSRSTAARFGLPEALCLRDLGREVWGDLPREAIYALADEVLAATRFVYPELLSSTTLVAIDPSGDGLSSRARNTLFRAGLLHTPWLTKVPLGTLAREKQLGAKTLLEILTAGAQLESVPASDPPPPVQMTIDDSRPSPAVRKAAGALRKRRWSSEIYPTDPRLGPRLQALDSTAQSARDAAELLAGRSFDSPGARVKAKELRKFIAEAERLRTITLEEELEQLMTLIVGSSRRQKAVVELRLGLGGQTPLTLAGAGDRVGLTRERVRQLEARFLKGVKDTRPWTPVLDKTLKLLSGSPMQAGEAEAMVRERGLSSGAFSLASVLSAARIFGKPSTLELDSESGVVYTGGEYVSPRAVASEARRLTTHWGATTIDALSAGLAERGADISPELLRALLEATPGLQWLDEEKDWFWVQGVSRNRLLNQAEKIMSVAGSIEISELREGVGRFYRMDGFRPPREVLARLCEQSGLCVRHGDVMVEGPSVGAWKDVLRSTLERGLAEILFEHGPVMRRDDLERIAVIERGLNEAASMSISATHR